MKKKAIATMGIIGLIFITILLVAFASLIGSLNIQPDIKRMLWILEVVILLMFVVFTVGS